MTFANVFVPPPPEPPQGYGWLSCLCSIYEWRVNVLPVRVKINYCCNFFSTILLILTPLDSGLSLVRMPCIHIKQSRCEPLRYLPALLLYTTPAPLITGQTDELDAPGLTLPRFWSLFTMTSSTHGPKSLLSQSKKVFSEGNGTLTNCVHPQMEVDIHRRLSLIKLIYLNTLVHWSKVCYKV